MERSKYFARQIEKLLVDAAKAALMPTVKVLLICGVTYRDLGKLLKASLIEASKEVLNFQGHQETIANIAMIAGISRKSVSTMMSEQKRGIALQLNSETIPERIVNGWITDPNFESILSLRSENDKRDFCSLVKTYGQDIPANTVKQFLVNLGFAEVLVDYFDIGSDGIILVNRPQEQHADKAHLIHFTGFYSKVHSKTVFSNLMGENSENRLWDQGRFSRHIPIEKRLDLLSKLNLAMSHHIDEIEDILDEFEDKQLQDDCEYCTVGVHFFQWQE